MGLDGVELLMDVEEKYGIAIPDDVATEMRTVGELYDFVLVECRQGQRASCSSAAAFYQVRQGICKSLHIDRNEVRPSTRIEDLIGRNGYLRFWKHLSQAMIRLRLPRLGTPIWLSIIIEFPLLWTGLVLIATLIAFSVAPTLFAGSIVALIALEIAIGFALVSVAEPIARRLPRDFQTVGELSRLIESKNQAWFVARKKTWDEHQVWETLQEIISKTLGVDNARVTRRARFVEDLGMG